MATKPSNLYHYTSFSALRSILQIEKEELCIRLSDPASCNDGKEIRFFEENVYEGTSGEELKSGEELRRKMEEAAAELGDPFFFCLIQHKQSVQHTQSGDSTRKGYLHAEIPMWEMYGDHGQGVRLQFGFKKLNDYISSIQDGDDTPVLKPCEYLNNDEMKVKGRMLRKQQSDPVTLYKEIPLYKNCQWVLENEWRAIFWGKKMDGGVYKKIPLSCLNSIRIGSKAKAEDREWLNSLKGELALRNVKIQQPNLNLK